MVCAMRTRDEGEDERATTRVSRLPVRPGLDASDGRAPAVNTYKVSGTLTMNVTAHVQAEDMERAKLWLMVVGQKLALERPDDDTEVGDFTWADVTVEQVS